MEKENLKPGDVLLCSAMALPGGWVGQAIVALTNGKVSHSGIYYGEKEGELYVAHSDLRGIILQPLEEFIDEEPGFYVARFKAEREDTDMIPVLAAVDHYAGKGIPYPKENFVVLGLLILMNRFSKKTKMARTFYRMTQYVGRKVIDLINTRFLSADSMTCSQFVSQSFTDAGEEYDIRFKKLLLDFGGFNSLGEEGSLLGSLDPEQELTDLELGSINLLPEEEAALAEDFISLINGKENENSMPEGVNPEELDRATQELLMAICKYFTDQKPDTVSEAIDLLSKNRNYFVLPDDLLSNTENLENLGYIKARGR